MQCNVKETCLCWECNAMLKKVVWVKNAMQYERNMHVLGMQCNVNETCLCWECDAMLMKLVCVGNVM